MPTGDGGGGDLAGGRHTMWSWAPPYIAIGAFVLSVTASVASAEPVALTFDDLPTLALDHSPRYSQITTERLIRGLHRQHLPVTGFVVGDQLEGNRQAAGRRLLRRWLNAGFELGNHTYSHASLSTVPVEAYIADVARDDALLRPLLRTRRQTSRWFRHPYLETGATLEAKHTFETWLAKAGYRIAPVSMENADWMFSPSYDDAISRHDGASAERIRQAYLDYTAKVVPWYRKAGLQLLGRRPSFVFLLHASRLNADSVNELASILRANDLDPVTLAKAMEDPAYALGDDFADPNGDQWLSRWARTLNRQLPWESYPPPPAEIAAEAKRLDPP